MSKELEALDEAWTTICHYNDEIIHDMGSEYIENPLEEEIDIVNNALLELKAIKEANPSEAINFIDALLNARLSDKHFINVANNETWLELANIKQALLKQQENTRSEQILQKYYQEGITLDSVRELKKENELLKEIIKSLFDKGCPLHQYNDTKFGLTIEVDDECSIMRLGEFKGVDLDKKLKEVLENEKN